MIGLVMSALMATMTVAVEPPVTYEEIVDEAMFNCKNVKWINVDEKLLWILVEAEKRYGVPPSMRGMILASACHESGYNVNAKGDWRTIRRRGREVRVAKAIGLFQMWPWWASPRGRYKIDRKDPTQSSDAYVRHITHQIPKVRRICKVRSPRRVWVAAWVTAIRSPKASGRCHEKPKHYRLLRKWHRNIVRIRKLKEEECGC